MKRHVNAILAAMALLTPVAGISPASAATTEFTAAGSYGSKAEWIFSDLWVGALNIASIPVIGLGETRVVDEGDDGSLVAGASVRSARLAYDEDTQALSVRSLHTGVGMLFNSVMWPSRRDSASTPGWLTLSNLEVDLQAGAVYADVSGDHDLIPRQRQRMWTFESAQSSTAPGSWPPGQVVVRQTVSGLHITEEGLDLFAQGLAWNAFARSSMSGVLDYGEIRAQFAVMVPEPASWSAFGMGLLGLCGFHAARRKSPAC